MYYVCWFYWASSHQNTTSEKKIYNKIRIRRFNREREKQIERERKKKNAKKTFLMRFTFIFVGWMLFFRGAVFLVLSARRQKLYAKNLTKSDFFFFWFVWFLVVVAGYFSGCLLQQRQQKKNCNIWIDQTRQRYSTKTQTICERLSCISTVHRSIIDATIDSTDTQQLWIWCCRWRFCSSLSVWRRRRWNMVTVFGPEQEQQQLS